MKLNIGVTAALIAASVSAAQAQPDDITSEPSTAAQQGDVIIVEARRLTDELKNTTFTMVRGRNNRVTIEIRADGTFSSSLNGLRSDFGNWRVERESVCFDGRMRGSFCTATLFFKRPGDTWVTTGLDGKRYEARLVSDD